MRDVIAVDDQFGEDPTTNLLQELPEKGTRALVADGARLFEVLAPSRIISSAPLVGYDFVKRSLWPKKLNPDNLAFICEYFSRRQKCNTYRMN